MVVVVVMMMMTTTTMTTISAIRPIKGSVLIMNMTGKDSYLMDTAGDDDDDDDNDDDDDLRDQANKGKCGDDEHDKRDSDLIDTAW